MKLLNTELLDTYNKMVDSKLLIENYERLVEAEVSTDTFSFYTSVSSVFSSKIEGEAVELDSFVKHKLLGAEFQPDYTRKIDDLYSAYIFAQKNDLCEENVMQVHRLLSAHIVGERGQGVLRTQNMYVITPNGSIEYVAVSPYELRGEIAEFYDDIAVLLSQGMTMQEVFFYAAMIHLVFVKIHPFIDGNGRSARLLEKWFLAQKLGAKSWYIQSERFYYEHHEEYYKNIRVLGIEYPLLDYSKALQFLLMLPKSVNNYGSK